MLQSTVITWGFISVHWETPFTLFLLEKVRGPSKWVHVFTTNHMSWKVLCGALWFVTCWMTPVWLPIVCSFFSANYFGLYWCESKTWRLLGVLFEFYWVYFVHCIAPISLYIIIHNYPPVAYILFNEHFFAFYNLATL